METVHEGMGSFTFMPLGDESYRLKITSPASMSEQPLPAVSTRGKSSYAGSGIFRAGTPLEFNLEATKAGIPLVVTAWCCGAQVGQQMLVTALHGRDHGPNPVVIPLDDQIGGVIRLIVYDYSSRPPQPVAERLIYRRMARRLTIHAEQPQNRHAPGEKSALRCSSPMKKASPSPPP